MAKEVLGTKEDAVELWNAGCAELKCGHLYMASICLGAAEAIYVSHEDTFNAGAVRQWQKTVQGRIAQLAL